MDVLYILGSGSKWNNNEIKYSFRSLEKHAHNVGRVFVVGEKCDFFSHQVIHIPFKDATDCPAKNHLMKVIHAIEETDISDNFLLNYDDNYLLEDVDIEQHPNYYKRDLPEKLIIDRPYRRCLVNSYEHLKEKGCGTLHYGVHCPMIYNGKKFMSLSDTWFIALNNNGGMSVRSVYGNMLNVNPTFINDVKIRNTRGAQNIIEHLKGKKFFSLHDKSLENGAKEALQFLFPNKGVYEK